MGRHIEVETKLKSDEDIDNVINLLQEAKDKGATAVFIDRKYYDKDNYFVELQAIRFSSKKEDAEEEIKQLYERIDTLRKVK